MNYMYCEQLLREIRKALYLHPLYISGKCNALQIVLNRDDFFDLWKEWYYGNKFKYSFAEITYDEPNWI